MNVLFGTSYTDLCYGYNAFWTRCLPYIDVDCDGFEVETLINIRLARAGLVVREVPSFEHLRIHGSSNLRPVRDGAALRPHDRQGALPLARHARSASRTTSPQSRRTTISRLEALEPGTAG